MARSLKKLSGRLKECRHYDLVEVRWVDASSVGVWMPRTNYSQTALFASVGYFDGVHVDKDRGKQIHLIRDIGIDNTNISGALGIPLDNIREFRVVSKGRVKD